jgi:hypothetical protein
MPGTRPGMTDIVTPILTHSFLTTSEIVSEQNATNLITVFMKREGPAQRLAPADRSRSGLDVDLAV